MQRGLFFGGEGLVGFVPDGLDLIVRETGFARGFLMVKAQ